MPEAPLAHDVAGSLVSSISLLRRRVRQLPIEGSLSIPERAALAHLERGGPATSADLARADQVTAQSMGTTVAALEHKGFVTRKADPDDGRRRVLTLTAAGRRALADRRSIRIKQLAATLDEQFSAAELYVLREAADLLDRLADRL